MAAAGRRARAAGAPSVGRARALGGDRPDSSAEVRRSRLVVSGFTTATVVGATGASGGAGGWMLLAGTDPRCALTVVDPVRGTLVTSVPLPAAVSALTVPRDGRRVFLALAADQPVLAAVRTDTHGVDIGWFMEEFTDTVSLAASRTAPRSASPTPTWAR